MVPLIIMQYTAQGSLTDIGNISELKMLFTAHGWTWTTAVSVILFTLMHWPCSTTCLTIKKETKSVKWTALSFIIPTLMGIAACFIFTAVAGLCGL